MHPARPPSSSDQAEALSVGFVVRQIRKQLESQYRKLVVEGEIADFTRARSGHLYFALRDEKEDAALRAVMWASDARRMRFRPEDGARVRATGSLTLYEARGTFQMRVLRLEPAGEGDLKRRFELTKKRLEAQGLLDPKRKRPLPVMPKRIGVVTSRSSAGLRDILKVLSERLPTPVLLAHASVQGDSAPREIIAALTRMAKVPDVDVVIVGRGGGSGDDLWAWNDEAVALAIARHPVPVVTAIGHETDVTIADLVADRRAATPSEAAMITAPDREHLLRNLTTIRLRLGRAQRMQLQRSRARLERLEHRFPDRWQLLGGPRQRLDELSRALEGRLGAASRRGRRQHHELELRLAKLQPRDKTRAARAEISELRHKLRAWATLELERSRAPILRHAAELEKLSPLKTLSRGYSVATRRDAPNQAITAATEVDEGDAIRVKLQQGSLDCDITKVNP